MVCDKVTPLFTDCQVKWYEDCVKRAVPYQIAICICFFCGMKVKKAGRRGEGKARKRDASARNYGLMANAGRCSVVTRPRGGRCTAQRRTAHVPRSLTGIRDGAAQHGRPLGRSTVAHFACKVRGATMKVRRQLNSLHYSP